MKVTHDFCLGRVCIVFEASDELGRLGADLSADQADELARELVASAARLRAEQRDCEEYLAGSDFILGLMKNAPDGGV